MKNLYYIAILPDDHLSQRITDIKLELKENFGVKHALKSPPHITLQMPFKWENDKLIEIENFLFTYAKEFSSFSIELSGFAYFGDRVIFIDVKENPELTKLHDSFVAQLIRKVGFPDVIQSTPFHPHITLAHRDMNKDVFKKIQYKLEKEKFKAGFQVKEIVLLKHNGAYWEVFRKYAMGK